MKVLLFDIDGTLVRAGGSGRLALDRAVTKVCGKKHACKELSLAGRTDRWNFQEAFRIAVGRKPTEAEFRGLRREYLRWLPHYLRRSLAKKTYLLPPGIKTLLRRLSREPGVLMGLGTGNIKEGARLKLGPSGFNPYFSFGGFGCDGMSRAHILKKAASRAKKLIPRPNGSLEYFVIGDTPWDVLAGKQAGFKTVAVGTGFATWASLKAAKPDFLARDFRGVDKWLSWFGIK